MNLASALIYRVLELEDFDTWTNVRKRYLPSEHHTLFDVIEKHTTKYHKLPTVEELKLEIRDAATLDKVYALETIETEVEPDFLLEAIKSEYAQREALSAMDKWVDASIAFESAEEVVRHVQRIGMELETKVELIPAEETMQRISLFESEDDMAARITLGFNDDFDRRFQFKPTDYIMVGGMRGAGKSITGSNIARHVIDTQGKKVLSFTIEMDSREVLQRDASIATRIPFTKIRNRHLSVQEWEKLARWWASRYIDGADAVEAYLQHRSFDKFHASVSRQPLIEAHLDIIHDPNLTLGRIHAELDKRIALGEDIGLVVVDYVQKVRRTAGGNFSVNNMEWQEQVFVSAGLKNAAQTYKVPFYSPFQIDDEGRARYARGILESPDAVFNLKANKGDVPSMTFETVKMRSADDTETFTSEMDWDSLYIGPRSVEPPAPAQKEGKKKQGFVSNIGMQTGEVYDL